MHNLLPERDSRIDQCFELVDRVQDRISLLNRSLDTMSRENKLSFEKVVIELDSLSNSLLKTQA